MKKKGFSIDKANDYSPLHLKLKIEPELRVSLHKFKKKSIILYHRSLNKKRFLAGITYFILPNKSAYLFGYIGMVAENFPESDLMIDKYQMLSDIYDESSIGKNDEVVKLIIDNMPKYLDKYLDNL